MAFPWSMSIETQQDTWTLKRWVWVCKDALTAKRSRTISMLTRQMIGLDGIALINVVANPSEADISGKKKLQTRITHNDGGSWKPLPPPAKDSLGMAYECQSTVSSRRTDCQHQSKTRFQFTGHRLTRTELCVADSWVHREARPQSDLQQSVGGRREFRLLRAVAVVEPDAKVLS